jgi:hypothetical protein
MALKLGTENKKQVIIASILGVVLLGVLVYEVSSGGLFGGSPAPSAPVAAPAAAPQAPARTSTASSSTGEGGTAAGVAATKVAAAPGNIDPTLHPELMAQAESLQYTGKGRNIFSLSSAPVDIPKPVKTARNDAPPVPTGPPPPPAIDLKFFGYLARSANAREALLLHGEDVFIAREGEVVDRRYRVEKIAATNVQITDLPYNNTPTLPLIQN